VIDEIAERIGVATNNVAEYRAVIKGIERAQALGAGELELIGDSELVARQLTGAYKVKHPSMKPLQRRRWRRSAALTAGGSGPFHVLRTPAPTSLSTPRSTRPPESRARPRFWFLLVVGPAQRLPL